MKHLRKFNESTNIYDINWHDIVPENITMIYANKPYDEAYEISQDLSTAESYDGRGIYLSSLSLLTSSLSSLLRLNKRLY